MIVALPQGRQAARRQREVNRNVANLEGRQFVPVRIQNREAIAGDRPTGAAMPRRARAETETGAERGPAKLGLPPVIDHRHAENALGPGERIRIGALPCEKQGAEPTGAVVGQPRAIGILALDRPDRGRRGEKDIYFMISNDPPERAGVGSADGLALIHHRCAAMDQRAIDDVAVAHRPADIGAGPEGLLSADAVDVGHRPCHRDGVAAIVVHYTLGNAGSTRRVENVERVGRSYAHAISTRCARARRRPVAISRRGQRGGQLWPLQNEAMFHRVFGQIERCVEQGLVGDDPGRLQAARCRQHQRRCRVVDPLRQFGRSEAAEHDRMHRADPRAGEHGEYRLWHHRHVDDDPVARADA